MSEQKSPFTLAEQALVEKHISHDVQMFLTPGHAMPAEIRCVKCNTRLLEVDSGKIAYWCSFGAEPKMHSDFTMRTTAH